MQASRIVDRTVLCKPLGGGFPDPVRIVTVRALPYDPGQKSAPSVFVFGAGVDRSQVSVGARTGPGSQTHQRTGALWQNRIVCTATSLRVTLSSKGLSGGGTGAVGTEFDCDVPAAIVVRLRAAFTRAVTVRRDPGFPYLLGAKGRMTTASLAVATTRGSPIAFASVDDASGRAKIYAARPRCVPD